MPLGIYSIIMSHKLHGGNSHNIPACNQSEFQVDNVNNDHEEFAMTMTMVTTLLVKYINEAARGV